MSANSELEQAVVDHLRMVAARLHGKQGDPGSVRPSSLVQEAWIRLSRNGLARGEFMLLATRVMRQILTDRARRRRAAKRGGDATRVDLDGIGSDPRAFDIVAVDTALAELESMDPRGVRVVELRCFGGLELSEVAEILSVSEKTVSRDWRACRAWLAMRLGEADDEAG